MKKELLCLLLALLTILELRADGIQIDSCSLETSPFTIKTIIPSRKAISLDENNTNGIETILEIFYCEGIGNLDVMGHLIKNNTSSGGFRAVFGKRVNEYWLLGVGIGYDKPLIPLTLESRMHFLNGNIHPLINMNAGYGFPFLSGYGCPIFSIAPGVSKDLEKGSVFLTIGCKWQKENASYYGTTNNGYISASVRTYYKFLAISMGIRF